MSSEQNVEFTKENIDIYLRLEAVPLKNRRQEAYMARLTECVREGMIFVN
jgi:hypothetical protein